MLTRCSCPACLSAEGPAAVTLAEKLGRDSTAENTDPKGFLLALLADHRLLLLTPEQCIDKANDTLVITCLLHLEGNREMNKRQQNSLTALEIFHTNSTVFHLKTTK